MEEISLVRSVIVTGGRAYSDYNTVKRVLDFLAPELVIQGGATGADSLAYIWAETNKISSQTFMAEWTKFGKKAGPLRNDEMLMCHPKALVVAFPGGIGTANCVEKAKKLKMIVLKVESF